MTLQNRQVYKNILEACRVYPQLIDNHPKAPMLKLESEGYVQIVKEVDEDDTSCIALVAHITKTGLEYIAGTEKPTTYDNEPVHIGGDLWKKVFWDGKWYRTTADAARAAGVSAGTMSKYRKAGYTCVEDVEDNDGRRLRWENPQTADK